MQKIINAIAIAHDLSVCIKPSISNENAIYLLKLRKITYIDDHALHINPCPIY